MKAAGDEVAKGIANADPLKVWVTDGAVFFPSCALWTRHGQNSGEDYGATIEKTAERAGTIVDVAVQIVKFTELFITVFTVFVRFVPVFTWVFIGLLSFRGFAPGMA